MKRILIFCLLLMALFSFNVSAATIFFDHFDSGTFLDNGWEDAVATFNEAGSKITASGDLKCAFNNATGPSGNISFHNETWRVDILHNEGAAGANDYTAITLKNDTNDCFPAATDDSVTIRVDCGNDNKVLLICNNACTCTGTTETACTAANQDVQSRIEFDGVNRITAFRNDSLTLNFTVTGCDMDDFFFLVFGRRSSGTDVDYINLTTPAAPFAPVIDNTTWNLTSASAGENSTAWRDGNEDVAIIIKGTTPTLTFDTIENAYCRIHTSDENWTTMGNGRNCSTTGGTSHICSLAAGDALTPGSGFNSLYIGCTNSAFNNETALSTNDAPLNVSLDSNCTAYWDLTPSFNINQSIYYWNETGQASATPLCTNACLVDEVNATPCLALPVQMNFSDSPGYNVTNVTNQSRLFANGNHAVVLPETANGSSAPNILLNFTLGYTVFNRTVHTFTITNGVNTSNVSNLTSRYWKISYDCRNQTSDGDELTDSGRLIVYWNATVGSSNETLEIVDCSGTVLDLANVTLCRYGIDRTNTTMTLQEKSQSECYDVP